MCLPSVRIYEIACTLFITPLKPLIVLLQPIIFLHLFSFGRVFWRILWWCCGNFRWSLGLHVSHFHLWWLWLWRRWKWTNVSPVRPSSPRIWSRTYFGVQELFCCKRLGRDSDYWVWAWCGFEKAYWTRVVGTVSKLLIPFALRLWGHLRPYPEVSSEWSFDLGSILILIGLQGSKWSHWSRVYVEVKVRVASWKKWRDWSGQRWL